MTVRGPLVELREVSAGYRGSRVLHRVSLSVAPGELLGLAGPNGSGKSTLLRAILGLLPPDSGTVTLGGTDVGTLSIRERSRRVAWMPQDESPQENIPIGDYVLFGRYSHLAPFVSEGGEDRDRVETALRAIGLWERRDSGILELSGGERQRVLLARALVQDAPLLLLDEPTAHLDIGHQLDLLERVRDLCHRTGKACIAALHDLNLAARYTDRLAVLSRGRLVEEGAPREVLSPELLREVWGVVAVLRQEPATGRPYLIPDLPRPPSRVPSRERGPVHVIGGGGAASGIYALLIDNGFRVTSGVLPLFDSDTESAERLGIPTVVTLPFAPVTDEARTRLRPLLEAAAATVLAPIPVGPSNLANLEEVAEGPKERPLFLFEPSGWEGRDFTGGAATRLRAKLLERGAVSVSELQELVRLLEAATRSSPAKPPAGPA